jgi:hypothetical protein
MEKLYIIKTNINSRFLDINYATEHPKEQQRRFADFLKEISEVYPEIKLPILAIIGDQVIVPDSLNASGARMFLPYNTREIGNLIDEYRIGKDTIIEGHTIPITAIVDFTNNPRVNLAYTLLKDKYNVQIQLNK